jgi:L-threonylcarbamoyladenylate synthase
MISTDINLAKESLKNNGVIGFPTETVYGLAGNAFNDLAIKKIFEIKKRPILNPLIVHLKSRYELDKVAIEIPEKAYRLAEAFWPGPLTLILKKNPSISDLITANQNTLAVRVPNHPIALDLLNQLEFPLVAPSANPFTRISPTTALHVENYFNNQIDMVLDGGTCLSGIESTIIGFENDSVILYRQGALAIEEIEKVIGKVSFLNKKENKTTTPGMHLKHYAPKTNFILTNDIESEIKRFKDQKIGVLLFKNKIGYHDIENQFVLSETGDLKQAASNLYNTLHQLDKSNLDVIIAEYFPEYGLGNTINDRLQRASKK